MSRSKNLPSLGREASRSSRARMRWRRTVAVQQANKPTAGPPQGERKRTPFRR